MHIIQSSEYFYIISQHILISTLYTSAYKSGTADNFSSRIFSVPVTLGYGNETEEILTAFAGMIPVPSGSLECSAQRNWK